MSTHDEEIYLFISFKQILLIPLLKPAAAGTSGYTQKFALLDEYRLSE